MWWCCEENVGVLRVSKARQRINPQNVPSVGNALNRRRHAFSGNTHHGLVSDYRLGNRVFMTHHQIFMPTGSNQTFHSQATSIYRSPLQFLS